MAMEFFSSIGGSIAAKAVELLFEPIWRPVSHVFNYNRNVQSLKNHVDELSSDKTRVLHSIEEARRRGEEIEDDVGRWLRNVDDITGEAQCVFGEEDESKKRCFMGLCPNVIKRYKISTEAERMAKKAVEIQGKKGKFDRVSYCPVIRGTGDRSFKDYKAFDSRTMVVNDIVDALKDGDANLIGVHGIPGVGKTTLVKMVAGKVKADNTFDMVVLAVVSQTPDLKRIQGEIADELGFKFDAETVKGRADRLRQRLMQEKNILIILDDIWRRLELEDVGIPFESDHQEHNDIEPKLELKNVGINRRRCKILMTSRDGNVLSREMGAKVKFPLNVLLDNEAWNLFVAMVGDDLKNLELQSVAAELVKRCAGLPILLITVARAVKNAEVSEWKDALKQLKKFDNGEIEAQVRSALELSFNCLKTDDMKSLFLFCGQMYHHNISVSVLLIYSMGLGLLRSNTLEDARNRLCKLVNDLKASSLLEEGDDNGIVKMHDVIHSFAISVSSRNHHVFTRASDTVLQEWPEKDTLEQCTAISLPFCQIPELPEVLECPKLESFLLGCQGPLMRIPDNLFREMKELKVLGLENINLSPWPFSLQFLNNLRSLCLYSCIMEDITIIGELKKLQFLSIFNSNIVQLPREIGQLTSLQLLQLRDCPRLEVIPPNVLSCLTKLEDLYMDNSFQQWEVEGLNDQRSNASLAELKLLPNLVSLDMHIIDAKMLPKDLFSEKLKRFRIFIGDGWDWSGVYKTSRTLKLKLYTGIQLEAGVKVLLKITEDLYLRELKDVSLYELDPQGFPQLKHLHIQDSVDIRFIADSITLMGPSVAFPRLELLALDNLNDLEKICHGQLKAESFSNLTILKVENCPRLKHLFSFSTAKVLLRLEEIVVTDCKSMEVIVAEDSGGDADKKDEVLKWSKLRKLTLERLPQLTSICSQVDGPSTSQTNARSNEILSKNELETPMPAFNEKIVFPNLEDLKLSSLKVAKIWHDQPVDLSYFHKLTNLTVEGCEKLKYLFTSFMVKSLAQLRRLEICDCKLIEEIIETAGATASEILFPKLDILKLDGLPKLIRFCTCNLIQGPYLKELQIENCPVLETFISNSATAERKPTLFDENVLFPNLEELQIFRMDNLKIIWHNELCPDSFCKLKVLKVRQGKKILNVFPPRMLRRIQNLEYLDVTDCASLEEVFDLQLLTNEKEAHDGTSTQLRKMYLWKLPSLKHVWNGNPQGIVSFRNLGLVNAYECPSIKSIFPASVALGLLQLEQLIIDTCGVEEIVAEEEGLGVVPKFMFPKMVSLVLWGLPKLKRFFPGRHTSEWPVLKKVDVYHCDNIATFDSEPQSFHRPRSDNQLEVQVQQSLMSFRKIVPNLEELTLSSKDTAMILQGQVPADFFHKIKLLELQCFHDVSLDFPFNLLERFQKMEKLLVTCCHFKEVFPCRLDSEEEHARSTLARIRYLKLHRLTYLERIWNQDFPVDHQLIQNLETLEVSACSKLINAAPSIASFRNLTALHIMQCDDLMYLIPSSTAKNLLQLTVMSVKKCSKVTEIVANEGDVEEGQITFMKLESLTLECLPSLTSFCSANHCFEFPSLAEVIVKQCPKMEFFSKGVSRTTKLRGVKLIEGENKKHWHGNLDITIQQLFTGMVGFQGLLQLKLSEFPRLKDAWHGELPGEFFCDLKSLAVEDCASFSSAISSNLLLSLNNLEELDVRNCDSLEEAFDLDGLNADQGHVGLLSKLEKFYLIELPRLSHVWNRHSLGTVDLKGLKLLKVHNCRTLRNIFTSSIGSVLEQLQELEVKWCPMIEGIITKGLEEEVKTDKIIFPQLNSIIIESLPNLTSFYSGSGVVECPSLKSVSIVDCLRTFASIFLRKQEPTENGTAEPKMQIAFSNLESMKLSSIKLEKIWLDQSCVQKLTSLTVEGCGNLRYLFTSSMVESLAQLQELKIHYCKHMEEIIVTERLGGEGNVSEIVFPKLSSLELKGLPKLIRFCICELLKCPALEVLRIAKCPDLKTFVSNSVSEEVGTTSSQPKRSNSTLFDVKVAFPNLEQLALDCMDGLEVIWHHELHSDSFSQLKVLEVEQGKKLLNIFPPKILRRFQNLEDLAVIDCASLEEMFDVQFLMNEKEAHDLTPTQLRKMYLEKLPSLKHVWNGNPQGILSFQNLQIVKALKCPDLKCLFSSSIALELLQLEKLVISECGIEEIVSKEEGVEAVPRFNFPKVTSLMLSNLPELRRFYPEMHTSEWPVLKELRVYHCEKMRVFDSERQNVQVPYKVEEIEIQVPQPLFSTGKITANLEELALNNKDTKMIWEGQFPADLFHKLKVLELQCFHDGSEGFPFGLVQRFQNIEKLVVRDGHFKQLFPNGLAFEGEHARALTRIRHLTLDCLPDLEHIWNKHFQVDLLHPNIETLQVWTCSSLIYLARSTVSFQNLKVLDVYQCKALIYLVTSSAAKLLIHLIEMKIRECDVVTEVVSNEGEEAENEIIFRRLECLTLDSLASLTSFCSANLTLKFPSLAEVTVIQCPKMNIFSQGVLSTPKLERVWLTRVYDQDRWKGNLNGTIQQLFKEMNTQDSEEE